MNKDNANTEEVEQSNEEMLRSLKKEDALESFEESDLQPLRTNLARGNERLYSSTSALQVPTNLLHQMSTRKRYTFDVKNHGSRSGSCSPSLKERATVSTAYGDGNSSISSIESFDPDILYDKMGFVELDLKDQQQLNKQLHASVDNLPPLFERMCDDTLEDAHAFSDLSVSSISRPASSVGGSSIAGDLGCHFLEALDELDEVQEEDCDNNNDGVILINMENLKLQSTEENNCDGTASAKVDSSD